MTPKQGLVHDYDLMANREGSAQGNTCIVCGANPVRYQWTDYSGEALCQRCGTPYQLKWGSDEQKGEGDYPYLSMKEGWLPAVREHWEATERFVPLGMFMSMPKDYTAAVEDFYAWVREHHPELVEDS